MKFLKIIGCSDSMMWYRNKIGDTVEFVGEDDQYYWSREPAGYKNIVKKRDAVIVDVDISLSDEQFHNVVNIVNHADCRDMVYTTHDAGQVTAVKERIVKALQQAHNS